MGGWGEQGAACGRLGGERAGSCLWEAAERESRELPVGGWGEGEQGAACGRLGRGRAGSCLWEVGERESRELPVGGWGEGEQGAACGRLRREQGAACGRLGRGRARSCLWEAGERDSRELPVGCWGEGERPAYLHLLYLPEVRVLVVAEQTASVLQLRLHLHALVVEDGELRLEAEVVGRLDDHALGQRLQLRHGQQRGEARHSTLDMTHSTTLNTQSGTRHSTQHSTLGMTFDMARDATISTRYGSQHDTCSSMFRRCDSRRR